MASFTPGPWTVGGEGCRFAGVGNVAFADFVSLTNITAPTVPAHHEPSDEEREANARLIAAAPELLTALREVSDRFERCVINSGSDPEFAAAAVAEYRALLARIDGKAEA